MEWMIRPLKRYADFRGRSRRKEYWLYVLFVILATIVLSVVDTALGLGGRTDVGAPAGATVGAGFRTAGGLLTGLFGLATLIPSIAVAVRRLHDIDRTGWWIVIPLGLYVLGIALTLGGVFGGGAPLAVVGGFMTLAGFVAAIALIVFLCLDGTRGPNRFGADPKDPAGADLHEVFR